jgi:hypothetical protein
MIEYFLKVIHNMLELFEAEMRDGNHFEKGLDGSDQFKSVRSNVEHL